MLVELPNLVSLICPVCRQLTERGRELWTLSLAEVLVESADGSEVLEGSLLCGNAGCQRRFPILDGIPILVPDPAALAQAQAASLAMPLHPETLGLLVGQGTDDLPLARLLEHLSIYLDAHWGDRSQPPPDGPLPGWGGAALFAAVAARAERPVSRAVELGCSVGRGLLALAGGAELTVGVELHFGALRAARRILAGEPLQYGRRKIGRHYQTAHIPPLAAAGRVALICGDALDPPLAPQGFERVVALNLLDSVRSPGQLLSVADGLCAPGGELLLASPYSWQSGVVEEAGRIGGAEPEAALRQALELGSGLEAPYAIESEQELPWQLRRDARSAQSYLVHTLLGHKRS